MVDDKYINEDIYKRVAAKNEVGVIVVRRILDTISSVIKETILEDNPKKSVKLDYLGNFFTSPKRREFIFNLREKAAKENGLTTDGGR